MMYYEGFGKSGCLVHSRVFFFSTLFVCKYTDPIHFFLTECNEYEFIVFCTCLFPISIACSMALLKSVCGAVGEVKWVSYSKKQPCKFKGNCTHALFLFQHGINSPEKGLQTPTSPGGFFT